MPQTCVFLMLGGIFILQLSTLGKCGSEDGGTPTAGTAEEATAQVHRWFSHMCYWVCIGATNVRVSYIGGYFYSTALLYRVCVVPEMPVPPRRELLKKRQPRYIFGFLICVIGSV